MRRTFAGLLFAIASVIGGVAVSGFWLQYTAFSPSHSRSAAKVVLGDKAIRSEIAKAIANATAAQLGLAPDVVEQVVLNTASKDEGANIMAGIVADSHARVIGASTKPVQITPTQLVQIFRDERAAVLPTITLPVEKVGALSIARQVLRWLVPISAGVAFVLMLLGFAAHPERSELVRSLGFLLLSLGVLLMLIGYVVPVALLPKLTDNVWAGAAPRLAKDSLPLLLGACLLLLGGGGLCLALAARSPRRDRWSQPVRRNRHEAVRRWG